MADAPVHLSVRPLLAADLPAYKALRDATLEADPDAFTSDAEAERRKEPADYLQRLGVNRRDGGHFVVGAFEAGALIGAIGCERDSRVKVRHVGHLIGMMVRADRRGRGIGGTLLDAAIADAMRAEGLDMLTLSVTDGNDAAIALYASRGFVAHGRLDDAIRVGPRRLAKLLMSRRLRA